MTEDIIKKGKDLRVFIAHGRQDNLVQYDYAVRTKDYLEKFGYEVEFYSFEGGHSVSTEALRRAVEWIVTSR